MAITRTIVDTVESLTSQYCNDVRRLKEAAGVTNPNVAPGSETYIKGQAVASAVNMALARIAALQDATMPDSAMGDDLIRLALVLRGIVPSTGAGATGYVIADCVGTVVYPVDAVCTSDDGLRYKVISTIAATSGSVIPVVGIDTGTRTNKTAGTVLTWASPPIGSNTTAIVGPGGLANGVDADTPASLRRKLQDALRHPQGGGTWQDFRSWATGATAAIQDAFVYPALRGPATCDVAVTVEGTQDNAYSRVASPTLLYLVASAIVAKMPSYCDVRVWPVVENNTWLQAKIVIPSAIASGGDGTGWIDADAARWPVPVYTGGSYVPGYVYSITNPTDITVQCQAGCPVPTAGAHIAIWSQTTRKFIHAVIKGYTTPAANRYRLTLYSAIDTASITANAASAAADWVSPDAVRMDAYGDYFATVFANLGPGEYTGTSSLPRNLRRPLQTEEWSGNLTTANLMAVSATYPEVSNLTVLYPASLPSAPVSGTIGAGPYVKSMSKLMLCHTTL